MDKIIGEEILKTTEDELNMHNDTTSFRPLRSTLHHVFSQLNKRGLACFVFQSETGQLLFDLQISERDVSSRTIKALHNSGYKSWRQIALSNYTVLRATPRVGDIALKEIKKFLISNIVFSEDESIRIAEDEIKKDLYSDIVSLCKFPVKIVDAFSCYLDSYLFKYGISDCYDDFRKILFKQSFIKNVLIQENVIKAISENIINDIPAYETWNDISQYFKPYPKYYHVVNLYSSCMKYMIRKGLIKQIDDLYIRQHPSYNKWFYSLDERERFIVSKSMSGLSQIDISSQLGISRGRVSQIFTKIVAQKPLLQEDEFSYWYVHYDLSFEEMNYIFDITQKRYNYYSVFFHKGSLPVDKILKDSKISNDIRKKYMDYCKKDMIVLFRRRIPGHRYDVLKCVVEHECIDKAWNISSFFEYYHKILRKKKLLDENLVFPSEASLLNKLSDLVIFDYENNFRYYPMHTNKIRRLVNTIDWHTYKNLEISSLRIFNDNLDLMCEYDIKDHYELFDILYKSHDIWHPEKRRIEFRHIPTIDIGNINKKTQIMSLIKRYSPIKKSEFIDIFGKNTGFSQYVFNTSWEQYIEKYLYNGTYIVAVHTISAAEEKYLKQKLKEDFYFFDDVDSIYHNKYKKDLNRNDLITVLLKNGFKTYVDYAVRNTYSSTNEYFINMFMSYKEFSISQIDSRIMHIETAAKVLRDLKKSMDIVEVSENHYIRYSVFHYRYPNLNKTKIQEYFSDVLACAGDNYFTLSSLKSEGFKNSLQAGMGMMLFEYLLKNSADVIAYKIGNHFLFRRYYNNATFDDFIRHLMGKDKKISMYDLHDILCDKYKIEIDSRTFELRFLSSKLYYNSDMRTVYIDKETFFEDWK